jgi:predicted membrane protein
MGDELISIVFPVFCVFIAAPSIVFGFILLQKRGRNRLEELRLKKEMLMLEVEREKFRHATMIEENRKYDRIIDGTVDPSQER